MSLVGISSLPCLAVDLAFQRVRFLPRRMSSFAERMAVFPETAHASAAPEVSLEKLLTQARVNVRVHARTNEHQVWALCWRLGQA